MIRAIALIGLAVALTACGGTAASTITQTQTQTVDRTPPSCMTAIAALKKVALSSTAQIVAAYRAGATGGSISVILAKIRTSTAVVNGALPAATDCANRSG
jgi:hypothetical protein